MENSSHSDSFTRSLLQYLFSFFRDAPLSSYYAYDYSDNLKWNIKPQNAIFKHGRWVPENPDGLTIGNNHVFSAIGVPELSAESVYEYYSGNGEYFPRILPSRMSLLVGPEKDTEHLKVLFNVVKFQDFYCSYFKKSQNHPKLSSLLSLDQFNFNRTLYRIEKTSIVYSIHHSSDISVKCVDFAPVIDGPKNMSNKIHLPAICRLLVLTNISNDRLEDLELGPAFVNFGSDWQLSINQSDGIPEISQYGCIGNSEGRYFRCYGNFSGTTYFADDPEEYTNVSFFNSIEQINISFASNNNKFTDVGFCVLPFQKKELKPGESLVLPYLFLLGKNENEFTDILQIIKDYYWVEPEISLFQRFLIQTLANTSNDHFFAQIHTSNPKVNGLVDSIFSIMKTHVGATALHTGSVYYPHSSAFVRDNFMFQRALAKAGYIDAVKQNAVFFYQCWKTSGIKNSYNTATHRGGASSKEMRVEIPSQFILMVKNLVEWTHDERFLTKYYPMIKDCADVMMACPNGLFIINSDEMWIWAVYCDEVSHYFDTSIIMIAGIEFACQAAKILNQDQDYINWSKKRDIWIKAVNDAFVITAEKRYAMGVDNSGFQDQSIMPNCLSRPILLDLLGLLSSYNTDIDHEFLAYNSMMHAWTILKSQPIVRSHSKTTAIIGNTPGLFLYAATAFDLPFAADVFNTVCEFPNCTGSVNEIHDLFNRAWGTERRRVGDSATILEGILHFLIGLEPKFKNFSFNPHLSESNGFVVSKNIKLFEKQMVIFACESQNLIDLLLRSDLDGIVINELFPPSLITSLIENYELFPISNQVFKIFSAAPINLSNHNPTTFTLATDIPGKVRINSDFRVFEFGIKPYLANLPMLIISSVSGEELKFQRFSDGLIKELLSNGVKEFFWILDFHEAQVDSEFLLLFNQEIMIICEYDEIEECYRLTLENSSRSRILCNFRNEIKIIEPSGSEILRTEIIPIKMREVQLDHALSESVSVISPFFLSLDHFFMQNGDENAVILYDEDSKAHAHQIIESLAIVKSQIFLQHQFDSDTTLEDIKYLAGGKNLVLISKKPLKNYLFATEFELASNFPGFSLFSTFLSDKADLIFIENVGHAYRDTHQICEFIGIFLQPCREKAMSMHPYGKFRLADLLGEAPSVPFPLEIAASQPLNFYLQGIHSHGTKLDCLYDPSKKNTLFKPIKPYCSFYTISPYVPFDIGAGGIAKGTNCLHLVGELDADEPIEVELKMIFEQNMQPVQFIIGNRERILDPTTLEKLPDGKKLLKIVMHPGRPLPDFIIGNKKDEKKRTFGYTFGKYPRFN